MYMNHYQIEELVKDGKMQNVDHSLINAASLDVRMGNIIFIESWSDKKIIDYKSRQKMNFQELEITEDGFLLSPGCFILANTIERCNFSDDMAALFRIKSSMGRIGLEHMDAGWVDPGFNGTLTLEFKNLNNYHPILLRPGDRIGQLIFFKGQSVGESESYRSKGNYNGQDKPAQIGYI